MNIDKKATIPLRIALNILYFTPKPELQVSDILHIPFKREECRSCKKRKKVAAISSASSCDSEDNVSQRLDTMGELNEEISQADGAESNLFSSVGSSEGPAEAPGGLDDHDYAANHVNQGFH